MKIILSLLLIISSQFTFGQQKTTRNNKIYHSNSDTVKYKYSIYPDTFKLILGKNDTISPGTNNAKGILMTAFIGKDTLKIAGHNYPFAQREYVTIQTPQKKTVVIFRYNTTPTGFTQEYIEKNDGKISFELPEVYELANIIWSLSPSGKRATDLQKNTPYYNRVEKYFDKYLNHPVFEKLNFEETREDYYDKYYDFRENSFIYKFDGNKLVNGGNYNYVYGSDWDNFTNLFTTLLPLVQDFAAKSNFRKFYADNKDFYASDIKRVEQLLPVKDMWSWLENEFPARHSSYKIVFSPLIGGSHSTQKYFAFNSRKKASFSETVMFICDANRYDLRKDLSEKEREGLMSGIVFTEIDHNYVNPVSSKYGKEISEIYSSKIWTDEKNNFYKNPVSVFNEYMTHAAFCLWALEKFDEKTATLVIDERVKMNRDRRGFVKFKEFNDVLIDLKKHNKTKTLTELYPEIIDWSKKQVDATNK